MRRLKVFEHSVRKDDRGHEFVSLRKSKVSFPFLKSKGVDEALKEAKQWLKRKGLTPKTININVDGDILAVVRRGS